jgi:hypothetical protein
MSDMLSDDFRSADAAEPVLPPAITRAAAAAVFLALVAGMSVWAYRLGTRDATEVPIIRALEGPARVQPEVPGGLETAHQGLAVNDVLAGTPEPAPAEAPTVAPPAVTLTEEDGPQGELVLAAPEFPAVEPPEGEELRMPPADEGPLPGEAGPAAEAPAETDLAALVPNLIAEALAGAEAAEDEAADAPAAPRPRTRPAGLVVRPAAAPAPVQAASPPGQTAIAQRPEAAAAPAALREVSSVDPGARLVQLGAFDNEALARQVWGQLVARNGDLLGGKSLFLERATHNARVFYRLRIAGFQNTDQTRVLCEQLRARGVDCIPVTLQ